MGRRHREVEQQRERIHAEERERREPGAPAPSGAASAARSDRKPASAIAPTARRAPATSPLADDSDDRGDHARDADAGERGAAPVHRRRAAQRGRTRNAPPRDQQRGATEMGTTTRNAARQDARSTLPGLLSVSVTIVPSRDSRSSPVSGASPPPDLRVMPSRPGHRHRWCRRNRCGRRRRSLACSARSCRGSSVRAARRRSGPEKSICTLSPEIRPPQRPSYMRSRKPKRPSTTPAVPTAAR